MQMAKYTEGSIARHIMVMTASGTTGLMIMFLSDLVDIYFLSLLGEVEIAAAVGFAASILFFMVSLNIGLSIGCSAIVSQAIGSSSEVESKSAVTYSGMSALLLCIPISIVVWMVAPKMLVFLGAEGKTLALATEYALIIIPSMPLMALGMSAGGVMRARGDAKGAMWITMIGGIVNVILDPIFIFVLDLGVQGAAIATVLSRTAMLAFGIYVVWYRDRLLGDFIYSMYPKRLIQYMKVAVPAVLTNLSTPISIAFVTYIMAQFGDSAVAGNAIISRIQPVAFAGLFALSGVVGPIAGQNFGAKKIDRVYNTLYEAIRFVIIYCLIVCTLLWLIQPLLVPLFSASDEANRLVYLFCSGVSLMFIFNGITFVTNAMFNNLGLAHYATLMSFLKATVGTVPFVYTGSLLYGPEGALWGLFMGSVIMALASLKAASILFKKFE